MCFGDCLQISHFFFFLHCIVSLLVTGTVDKQCHKIECMARQTSECNREICISSQSANESPTGLPSSDSVPQLIRLLIVVVGELWLTAKFPPSSLLVEEEEKRGWGNSCVEIQTDRLLTNYLCGQNRCSLQNIVRSSRDEVRKAKVQMELNQASDAKDNKGHEDSQGNRASVLGEKAEN